MLQWYIVKKYADLNRVIKTESWEQSPPTSIKLILMAAKEEPFTAIKTKSVKPSFSLSENC